MVSPVAPSSLVCHTAQSSLLDQGIAVLLAVCNEQELPFLKDRLPSAWGATHSEDTWTRWRLLCLWLVPVWLLTDITCGTLSGRINPNGYLNDIKWFMFGGFNGMLSCLESFQQRSCLPLLVNSDEIPPVVMWLDGKNGNIDVRNPPEDRVLM